MKRKVCVRVPSHAIHNFVYDRSEVVVGLSVNQFKLYVEYVDE